MERYESYKDSGVEWIGKVPEHWKVMKTSLLYANIGSGTTPSTTKQDYYEDDGFFWLQTGDLNDGYITDTSKKISKIAIKDCKLRFYPVGSIVIAMYGATIGKIGLLKIPTSTNQACCVLPYSNKMNEMYAFYVCQIAKSQMLLEAVGGGQPNISQDIIKKLKLPVPPLCEQQALAAYLDKRCGEIDKAIATQQKRIALLQELKQSIITQTVTKGIHPDVPLKESGVEWIGNVPEHWEVMKTSLLYTNIGSGTTPSTSKQEYYEDNGFFWLQTGDLNDGYITDTSKKISKVAVKDCKLRFYPVGSIVIAMYGATIGKIGLLKISTSTNQACCVLPYSNKMNEMYAFYVCQIAKKQMLLEAVGGGQPNISQDIIKKLKLPVPPLCEQQAIAIYLDRRCSEIDKAITTQQKRISLLQELRQSVITETITGKIKVI